ncbi:molybdenum cofactor guanylyltransferase [Parasphingorhabdus sp.]|uniref:molybdenum cofactor guanylyltransferase n=1 Tax=Parasphingorhabdus sp. TaxID=2709688 RepID=UPI0032663278
MSSPPSPESLYRPSDPCLVILAGGESRRMGRQKATITLGGERLIDRVIERYREKVETILISGPHDFDTGLDHIADDEQAPRGPAGAIFSIASQISASRPACTGFVTVPVDAPFSPTDLIEKLSKNDGCAVAEGPNRLHPTFAYWNCDIVNAVQSTHDLSGDPPSLHWMTRQCGAQVVSWPQEAGFMNINTPEDLADAEAMIKKKPADRGNVHRLF